MTRSPGISLYNQDRFDDADFVANFVARNRQVDALLNGLRNIVEGGPTEHEILVGTRGMGKTSLLRRLAIGIQDDPDLKAAFIPLRFREEQYNIISLDAFWRNCGESLAEYCEQQGNQDLADKLDIAIETPAWRDDVKAQNAFLAACKEAGGRAILLLDNLDLILAGLKPDGCWILRNALQKDNGPIVIGAATQLLAQGADREAPFYEFFNPHILEPLTERELLACLNALATRRGTAGTPVKAILAREPERVRALYVLTGGNPRILGLVYGLLEQADSATIFADLEALLDQVTPFYKARIEEYQTPLQRAVIDGIALNWDPITSGSLSRQTGIENTTLSPQLIRLKKDGLIEEVETSGTRSGYQLSERFLNIWYLMRHGTRKTKQRLRWFTLFLTKLFSAEELQRMAGDARSSNATSHPFYREALYEACDLLMLHNTASLNIKIPVKGIGISNNKHQFDAASRADSASVQSESQLEIDLKNVLDLLGMGKFVDVLENSQKIISERLGNDSTLMTQNLVARLKNCQGIALNGLDRFEEAITIFNEVLERVANSRSRDFQERETAASINKASSLAGLSRHEEALIVYDQIVVRFEASNEPFFQGRVAWALNEKGRLLRRLKRPAEAMIAFDQVLKRLSGNRDPEYNEEIASALINKTLSLVELDSLKDAISVCDQIIYYFEDSDSSSLQIKVTWAFNEKGLRLRQLKQAEEAILIFDRNLDRLDKGDTRNFDEGIAVALNGKSLSLSDLGRLPEAIDACDQIISYFEASDKPFLQMKIAWAFNEKGRRLKQLQRPEEAITSFNQVLERFGKSDTPEIIEEVALALVNKSLTLFDLNRSQEAIDVCDQIISRFEASSTPFLQARFAWAINEKGQWLRQLKQPEEAIALFDQILERFGAADIPQINDSIADAAINKSNSLVDLGKITEAVDVLRYRSDIFRRSINFNSLSVRKILSNLEFNKAWTLFSYLNENIESEVAFRDAALFDSECIPSKANLCWVLLAKSKLEAAQEVFAELKKFVGAGRRLWEAGFKIVADDLQSSLSYMGTVLQVGLEDEGFEYFEALLWYLRIGADRGYGEELIDWFVATGNADRYAPIYGALVAHVRGERFLLDLNPEVRGIAEPLYARLSPGKRNRNKKGRHKNLTRKLMR